MPPRVEAMSNITTEKINQALSGLRLHLKYSRKSGDCDGDDDWCMENALGALVPMAGLGAVLLWPAYLGARLWIAVWCAIPFLFGYRFRVVIVEGKAGDKLVRRGPAHGPDEYAYRPASEARAPAARKASSGRGR